MSTIETLESRRTADADGARAIPETATADPCETMAWDSRFFGFPVAKVRGDVLDESRSAAIDAWCRQRQIRWLNFVACSNDAATVLCAERRGYHLADVRMTYHWYANQPLPPAAQDDERIPVRMAVPEDVPVLRQIAAASHGDSRIYHDPQLPKPVCDEFFATWIENSVNGFATCVLVTGEPGRPTSYVTCHLRPERQWATLGLMAVERGAQGSGVGRAICMAGLRWVQQHAAKRVELVTQGRNIIAQRLYQKIGFSLRKLELQYHKWYEPTDGVR